MQTTRHLVAGTDFSPYAAEAFGLSILLASLARATVTLVHVCELGVDDLDEEHRQKCQQALLAMVSRHRGEGVAVTGLLRSGNPWEKLDNVAVEVGASLIVVGRHGAGRGLFAPIGSVAERLVRTASRPVLTVPHDV